MRDFQDTWPVHAETARLLRHLGDRSAEAQAPACTGPCQQGRRPCPTPQACQTTGEAADREADRAPQMLGAALLAASAAVAVLLVALLVHGISAAGRAWGWW